MPATISSRVDYQYVLELYREDDLGHSEQIATARVKPDWDPAIEWTRFECARRLVEMSAADSSGGALSMRLGAEKVSIDPIWSDRLGEPYVKSFRATAVSENGREGFCDIPTAFLEPLAEKASTKVIESGKLEMGESFRYLVTAYPHDAVKPSKAPAFTIEPLAQEIGLQPRSYRDYLARSRPYGPIDEADLPVFIPDSVLEEGRSALEETGAAETGGILIGFMNFDAVMNRLFLEVTAQIRARHTKEELSSLTFTPETWSDVDAAIRLRGLNELQIGWWHTHPAKHWCKDCPVENRRVCQRSGEFFSSDDMLLHRTVFPRAYSVGLVISDSYNDGLTWPLFGWKQGTVQRRGFHVVRG